VSRSVLDEFLPHPDARERFAVVVRAPALRTYRVATDFDLESVAPIRAVFRARERLLGGRRRPRSATGLVAERLADGWGTLIERPGEVFAAGAACRPWEAEVTFRPLGPDDFTAFCEPGLVKIAWTLETTVLDDERTELATETRAVATDAAARVRFLRYWRWARFGIHPIRWLLLPAIRRAAERSTDGPVQP
jgi:hypothetical protein